MESPSTPTAPTRRPRNLALGLVEAMTARIREGKMRSGDKLPTEAAIMGEFGVSRTVVREALSKLQAGGLVETRHGVGTFVVGTGEASNFRIAPEQIATAREVIAVLELRIGLETEAAGLAAVRRTDTNLQAMRRCVAPSQASARRSTKTATRSRPTSSSIWKSRAPLRTCTSSS
jgi:GntR family transcriptional regulator, transcriptional repressor for pyruvate dehydrogenase complex